MWLAYTIASSRQPEDGANVFGAAVARWVDCTLSLRRHVVDSGNVNGAVAAVADLHPRLE